MARQNGASSALEDAEWNKKKYIWIPNQDKSNNHQSYNLARLSKHLDDDHVEVVLESNNQKITVKVSDLEPCNPPKFDSVEDMAHLTRLNIPSVLHHLKKRYHNGLIYTYSGLFCVVINPYKQLPIYGEKHMDSYKGKKKHEVQPHVYAVADNAYRDMLQNKSDQSILCTGESGAGKTENTKKVIQHLTHIAGSRQGDGRLEQQILQSNPIMEAFGNAKTIKNDNSSRFGKFIKVNFDQSGVISGATINTYILEKARVINQASEGKERNFHIFYQLAAGADEKLKKELFLDDLSSYPYMSNGNVTVPGMNDAQEFQDTVAAMKTMGMKPDEIKGCWEVVSSVLMLGNISKNIGSDRSGENAKFSETDCVDKFCKLSGISTKDFSQALLKPKIKVGPQVVQKSQNAEQVRFAIQALAKAIYERLFDWLLKKINSSLRENVGRPGLTFIGILDIAGFEIFEKNSFEQLCINLTNERLQQLFNHTLFEKEQQEYQQEGIEWQQVDYALDLVPTIELISSPGSQSKNPGIMNLLDQTCLLRNATSKDFVDSVKKTHEKNKKFVAPKAGQRNFDFAVEHYAGEVKYNADDWPAKNMDQLNDNVVSLLGGSKKQTMKELWPDAKAVVSRQKTQMIQQESLSRGMSNKRGGQAGKGLRRTVGALYTIQLKELMQTLNATQANFVRCIIPNHQKRPGFLDEPLIEGQLRCNGVIEGIRIVRQGYPNRTTFSDFRQRYSILCPSIANSLDPNAREICQQMLDDFDLKETTEYKLGHSKVFFKVGILAELEERRDVKLEQLIIKLQARARGYLARKKRVNKSQQERCIKILQRNMAIYLKVKQWQWWHLMNRVKPLLDMRKTEAKVEEAEEKAKKTREELNSVTEKFKNMENRFNDVNEELDSYKTELQEKTYQIEELESARLNAERDHADLSTQWEIAMNELDSEKDVNKKLEKKLKQDQIQLEKLSEDLADADSARQKLHEEKVQLDARSKQIENDLENAVEKLDRLNRDKKSLSEQLEIANQASGKSASDYKKLASEKARIQNELEETNEFLNNAKNQINELNNKSRGLSNQKSDLESQLAEALTKIKQLEAQVTSLKSEIGDLKEALEHANQKLEASKRKEAELADNLSDEQEKVEKLSGEKARLNKKVQELTQEAQTLKDELYDNEDQKSDIAKRLNDELARNKDEFETVRTQLESEIESVKKAKSLLGNEKTELETKISKLESNLSKVSAEKSCLDKNSQEEIADLKKQLQKTNSQLKSVEGKLNNANQELDQIKIQLDSEIQKSASLQKKADSGNSRIEELEIEVSSLATKYNAVSTENEEHKTSIDELCSEKSRLQSKLQQAVRESADSKADIDDILADKEALESRLKQNQQQLEAEKSKLEQSLLVVSELESEKDGLRRKLGERDNECQELEGKLRVSQGAVKKMQQQKEDLQMELDQVSAQVSGIGRLEGKYERELRTLREQITLLTTERDTAQSSIREAEANAFRQKSRADELESDLETTKKQLRLANTELDELEANLANNEDMEALVKENKNLRKELQVKNVELQEAEDTTFDAEARAQRLQGENLNLQTLLNEKTSELEGVQIDGEGRNNRLKNQIKEKDDEIADLTRQKLNSEKLRSDLSRELEEKESALQEAEESSRYLSEEMGKLKKRLIESDEELSQLLVVKTSYEELKRGSEIQNRQKQGIIDELEAQIVQLNASKRQAEEKFADLESDYEGMILREKTAIASKTALQSKIHQLQDDQDDLQNEADSAQANCRIAEQKLAENEALINQLKQDVEESEESLRRSKNKVKSLEDELVNVSEAERRRMEVELRNLKQQIIEKEDEVKKFSDQVEKEKRDSKRYKRQAAESENKIQDSLRKIAELEGEVNRGRAAVRRAKNEAEDYKDEAERLKKQTKRLRDEIDELMK